MEVSRDCEWTDIIGQVFRVLEFDRAGTTIRSGNKLKTKGFFKPYGYLLVESPILNQPVRLPIVHRDDFLLAASVFDEPEWVEKVKDNELLVTYVPKRMLPRGVVGTSHGLHYVITPPGTLELYYEFKDGLHVRNPAPEKLFGTLVWDGLLRVKVNPEPKI